MEIFFIIRKKRAPYSFSIDSIRTDKVDHEMQNTQKKGYLSSDKLHTKFGSSVALYLEV